MFLSFRELQGASWINKLRENHSTALQACGIYLLCLLLAFPAGDFPLNDDWTYAKSLIKFGDKGIIDLGTSASSLLTQLCWGLLFIKVFGFSFVVLRISTWVSVILSIFIVDSVLRTWNVDRRIRLFIILGMVLSPLYFSLSNTFMTDVNFCTLLFCCFHQANLYMKQPKISYLLGFFAFSFLLVFLRQFGFIIPCVFLVTVLLMPGRSWKLFFVGLGCFLVLYFALMLYERHLADIGAMSYQSSQKIDLFESGFWLNLALSLQRRFSAIIINILVWSCPVLLIYLSAFYRLAGLKVFLSAVGVATFACVLLYTPSGFPIGNVFDNMNLGAETFYRTLIAPGAGNQHTHSPTFRLLSNIVQAGATVLSLTVLLMLPIILKKNRDRWTVSFVIFIILFIAGYTFLLMLPEMFLDRYFIPPAFALMLLVVRAAPPQVPRNLIFLVIAPLFYVSVAGTHDYFELNRVRWEANSHLREELNVPMERINGGYEVNCWHEGKDFNWFDHVLIENHDYLIQYDWEPGFSAYREYGFRRWFPFKKDKIYIFERDQKRSTTE